MHEKTTAARTRVGVYVDRTHRNSMSLVEIVHVVDVIHTKISRHLYIQQDKRSEIVDDHGLENTPRMTREGMEREVRSTSPSGIARRCASNVLVLENGGSCVQSLWEPAALSTLWLLIPRTESGGWPLNPLHEAPCERYA